MERKTKKMVATEVEISQKMAEVDALHTKIEALNNYKPSSKDAQDAKEQAISEFISKRDTFNSDIQKLRIQFEVLTVDMLAGKDVDMADPTPAESLRNAS